MPKSFSDRERELIRARLVTACQECWSRYGYQKTGIRELADLADISAGAFYQFFDSKELLFVAAADAYQADLVGQFHAAVAADPGPGGVAAGLKQIAHTMSALPWMTAMQRDWPVIARKLPADYVEQDFRADTARIGDIIEQYTLHPTHDLATTTRAIETLLAGLGAIAQTPGLDPAASDLIIDAVSVALFTKEAHA